MGLDDAYFVVFFTLFYLTAPVVALAAITPNPFTRRKDDSDNEGWWARYRRALKTRGDPRRQPFAVPGWLYVLLHLIVSALMIVPVYSVFHNAGANDGWSACPIPLMFAFMAEGFYIQWLSLHLATKGRSNILFVQILCIGACLIATIELIKATTLGWMSLPYLVWQLVFLWKLWIEHYYTYDAKSEE